MSVKTTASTSAKTQISKRIINSSNWQKHLTDLEDQKILVRLGTRLGVRFANCKVTLKLNSVNLEEDRKSDILLSTPEVPSSLLKSPITEIGSDTATPSITSSASPVKLVAFIKSHKGDEHSPIEEE